MNQSYSELVARHGGIRAAARAIDMPYTSFHTSYKKETQDPILLDIMEHEGTELVPANLSMINKTAADNRTGKERTPRIAVTKNAHTVSGNLVIVIPFVLKLSTVTM